MVHMKYLAVLIVLAASLALSQVSSVTPDSLAPKQQDRTYTLPEYVVSATRWQVNAQNLASSATVLTSADIAAKNGSSLADALEGIPGLFLKSYGGPGSVSTTSLRGMGAEHTLVLIDGQRYNNVRDGQVDFGVFLLQNIDRIEVLRGGYSSIYGADALGGIINIITRRSGSKSRANGEFSVGSYGMNGQQFGVELMLGGMGLQLAAKREAGTGDYKFNFNDGLTSSVLRRQNADYAVSQVQLLADLPVRENLTIRLSNLYNWSDRGSPTAVLSQGSSNKARLRDGGFLTQMTIDWLAHPTLSFRLSSMFNAQHRQYFDPLAATIDDNTESEFADRTIVLTPQIRYVLSTQTSLVAGGEYSHSAISSRQLASADRGQESIFVSSDHIIELHREFLYQVSVYPSIRYDHFSDVPGSLDPKLGVNVALWRSPGIRFRSSYGRSFRAPTFYDLYWKSGGNPDLRPERSLSFDAGLAFSSDFFGPVEFEANYFDIRTNDRIVWTPDNNGLWSPKNLQKVKSNGIELIAAWHLMNDHVVLRGSYSDADSRKASSDSPNDQTVDKQLPFIPHETAGTSLSLAFGS